MMKMLNKTGKNLKLLWLLLVMLAIAGHSRAQFFAGDQAPEIQLLDPNGQMVQLSSFRGKMVLVDFWASWCGPCRLANPKLVKLYAELKDKGFEILGVSLDVDQQAWVKAIKKDKLTWPQVLAPGGWEAKTAAEWGIEAIPASYLIDEEGKIIAADPSAEQIKNLVNSRTIKAHAKP